MLTVKLEGVIGSFSIQADIEAGGQGAPLAPLLHRTLFPSDATCAVLNLGGIANVVAAEIGKRRPK